MKKLLLCIGALSLAACQLPLVTATAPAPLAQTTIDDNALDVVWKSLDAALDGINLALDLKPNLSGTPAAKRVADGIDAVTAALTAAEHAAAAGSTTDYAKALAEAKSAYAELRLALQALKGA